MTIGGNTGQIQRLRNFSEIPLTFNHTHHKPTPENGLNIEDAIDLAIQDQPFQGVLT